MVIGARGFGRLGLLFFATGGGGGAVLVAVVLVAVSAVLIVIVVFEVRGFCLAVQVAAFLDRATAMQAGVVLLVLVRVQQAADAVGPIDGAREVRDVLGHGVLAADGARVDAVALARLAHGIVAAVKVLALLEVLGEVVAAAGQLAVQPEEPLLLGGEGLPAGERVLETVQPDYVCSCTLRPGSAGGKVKTYIDVDFLRPVRVHGCGRDSCARLTD